MNEKPMAINMVKDRKPITTAMGKKYGRNTDKNRNIGNRNN
jgi:hypothetical protein